MKLSKIYRKAEKRGKEKRKEHFRFSTTSFSKNYLDTHRNI